MINYNDFPADSWDKTVDSSEVRRIIKEEIKAEGKRIVESLVKAISTEPTAETNPTVRCKDCKYLSITNEVPEYAYCRNHNHTFYLWEEDTREHFCSWGERKEESDTQI